VPTLGDIGPGETTTARGRIAFVEGGAEHALRLLAF